MEDDGQGDHDKSDERGILGSQKMKCPAERPNFHYHSIIERSVLCARQNLKISKESLKPRSENEELFL